MSNYSSKTNPGGATTELQYNNNGAFDGVTELTWDDAAKILQLFGSTAVVQRASGQSTNLTEWQDSLGVASATVTSDGKFGNRQGYIGAQAFGHGATVTGNYATVIGENTTASQYGAAIGYAATAVDRGTAFGQTTSVTGIYGTALGNQATASTSAVAVGYVASAAQDALAIGYGTSTARLGVSLGYQANSGVASTETFGIAIGAYTVAPSNGVTIGANSSVTGTRGIAIGARAVTSGANSIAIGYDADAVGSTSITIGYFATADSDGVGLGRQTNAGVEGTAIGATAVAANQATSVGEAAGFNGTAQFGVAVGRLSKCGISSVAVGHQTDAVDYSTAVGANCTTTAAYQFVAGGNSTAKRNEVYFGNGVTNASPESYTINGTSATSGSNANGGNVTLKAGTGDGTGTNGLIILANLPTSDPGVTGALWNDGGTLKVS